VIRLPTPFIGQDAAVDRAASRRNLGLWLFGAPPLRSRPAAYVKRSHSIGVRFETASNALEVTEVSAVGSVHESTLGAGLRGISCACSFNGDPLLGALVLNGEPQEAVGNSVHALARLPTPLATTLPQMPEALDGYSSVKSLCQFQEFAGEFPAARAGVVPLSLAEPLELLAGPASAIGISIGLELRPSSLESRLHPRQVLPQVELPQHFALSAQDGHGNSAAVDVHPEHVQALSLRWRFFSQDGEELEVLTHDHGAYPPAIFEMCQHTMPSPISSYRKTYSCEVRTNAQSWVASLGALEAKKATVEPHNRAFDVRSGFTNPPGVASSLAHELSRNAEPLSMLVIGQAVQFSAVFNFTCVKQSEALLSHLKKGAVDLLQLRLLDAGQGEHVEREAFLHGYHARLNWCYLNGLPREVAESIRSQFFPAEAWISLEV